MTASLLAENKGGKKRCPDGQRFFSGSWFVVRGSPHRGAGRRRRSERLLLTQKDPRMMTETFMRQSLFLVARGSWFVASGSPHRGAGRRRRSERLLLTQKDPRMMTETFMRQSLFLVARGSWFVASGSPHRGAGRRRRSERLLLTQKDPRMMNIVMRGSFCERRIALFIIIYGGRPTWRPYMRTADGGLRTAGRPLGVPYKGVPYMGVPTFDGLLRGRPGVRDNRAGRSRQRL